MSKRAKPRSWYRDTMAKHGLYDGLSLRCRMNMASWAEHLEECLGAAKMSPEHAFLTARLVWLRFGALKHEADLKRKEDL